MSSKKKPHNIAEEILDIVESTNEIVSHILEYIEKLQKEEEDLNSYIDEAHALKEKTRLDK